MTASDGALSWPETGQSLLAGSYLAEEIAVTKPFLLSLSESMDRDGWRR
jgi:hypothetical protein